MTVTESTYNDFWALIQDGFDQVTRYEHEIDTVNNVSNFSPENVVLLHPSKKVMRMLFEELQVGDELSAEQKILGILTFVFDLYKSIFKSTNNTEYMSEYHEIVRVIQNHDTTNQSENFVWKCKLEELKKQRKLELQRYETEYKMLEQKVKFQQCEVEAAVQELVKKNTFLSQVRKDLYKISKHTVGEGNDIVEQLLDRLDRNMVSLESTIELKKQWKDIHADFMNQLKLNILTLPVWSAKLPLYCV